VRARRELVDEHPAVVGDEALDREQPLDLEPLGDAERELGARRARRRGRRRRAARSTRAPRRVVVVRRRVHGHLPARRARDEHRELEARSSRCSTTLRGRPRLPRRAGAVEVGHVRLPAPS
jgi:hypothetical protein